MYPSLSHIFDIQKPHQVCLQDTIHYYAPIGLLKDNSTTFTTFGQAALPVMALHIPWRIPLMAARNNDVFGKYIGDPIIGVSIRSGSVVSVSVLDSTVMRSL